MFLTGYFDGLLYLFDSLWTDDKSATYSDNDVTSKSCDFIKFILIDWLIDQLTIIDITLLTNINDL